jgi:glutamate synthase (NADPH) large chain
MVFLPVEPHERMRCEAIVEEIVRDEGLTVLGWRDTPVNANTIGRLARSTQPYIEQVFIRRAYGMDQDALERKLYVIRKRAEKEVANTDLREKSFFYVPSLSFPDDRLQRPAAGASDRQLLPRAVEFGSAERLCLVHQRFSTNTFPTWHLAHPYRYICHNGEINTLRGNVNWMQARTSVLASPFSATTSRSLNPSLRRAEAIPPTSTTPSNC